MMFLVFWRTEERFTLALFDISSFVAALDPTVEIKRVANPIILNSELRRKAAKAKKQLGF